ncbi:MAG: hypothetical protein GC189_07875 [Alphaproteobacteria bacterium]|nr:hypothetical protein [Alphaproteobacteria bacterium]
MSREQMIDDLAYVRTLAEEGRDGPLFGGTFFIIWGVLTATAWALQWALIQGLVVAQPNWEFGILWATYVALGVGSTAFESQRLAKDGQRTASVASKAEGAVWRAAGWGISAVAAGAIGRMIIARDVTAPDIIVPTAFALYGVALLLTSAMSRETWLRGFGLVSLAFAFTCGLILSSTWFYLVASIGALIVLLAPGIHLLGKETRGAAG